MNQELFNQTHGIEEPRFVERKKRKENQSAIPAVGSLEIRNRRIKFHS
jgi:hypothetical protein